MPKSRPPSASEFRQQILELARTGSASDEPLDPAAGFEFVRANLAEPTSESPSVSSIRPSGAPMSLRLPTSSCPSPKRLHAFSYCLLLPGSDRVAAAAELEATFTWAHRRSAAVAVEMERSAESAGSASAKANCVASALTLCLGDGGRFRVEASWETPGGAVGAGTAVPFRRDTGLFWFFDASNIELIVKVLDACGAPFDRFWVFAGGLTNVDVNLRVTDTVTGDVRLYQNPQDQRYAPIQDTDAFATCGAP